MNAIPGDRLVIALGGNAIERDGDYYSKEAVETAMMAMAPLIQDFGRRLAIVHGNGPQYKKEVDDYPDLQPWQCIERTQRKIGRLIHPAFRQISGIRRFRVDFTRGVADPMDRAFNHPTKPVGLWTLTPPENGDPYITQPDAGGRTLYRRVVPSPKIVGVPNIDAIRGRFDETEFQVVLGGGGVPIFIDGDGQIYYCPECVFDKDGSASFLGDAVDADGLWILTNVAGYDEHYGQDGKSPLITPWMRPSEAVEHAEDDGSMGPKLVHSAGFVGNHPSRYAVITSIAEFLKASQGGRYTSTVISNNRMAMA